MSLPSTQHGSGCFTKAEAARLPVLHSDGSLTAGPSSLGVKHPRPSPASRAVSPSPVEAAAPHLLRVLPHKGPEALAQAGLPARRAPRSRPSPHCSVNPYLWCTAGACHILRRATAHLVSFHNHLIPTPFSTHTRGQEFILDVTQSNQGPLRPTVGPSAHPPDSIPPPFFVPLPKATALWILKTASCILSLTSQRCSPRKIILGLSFMSP